MRIHCLYQFILQNTPLLYKGLSLRVQSPGYLIGSWTTRPYVSSVGWQSKKIPGKVIPALIYVPVLLVSKRQTERQAGQITWYLQRATTGSFSVSSFCLSCLKCLTSTAVIFPSCKPSMLWRLEIYRTPTFLTQIYKRVTRLCRRFSGFLTCFV